MKEKMELLKKSLEEFAKKHKNEINKNPEFRHHFHQMCIKCGVDPLSSHKGFWADLVKLKRKINSKKVRSGRFLL
jgi:ESCRT-II complex subunit VPS22